jgi:two-component system NtrC family sensor kinase
MNSRANKQVRGNQSNEHQEANLNTSVLWLYERALAATSCGIVISDARIADHPLIYCNPAFLQITGYSREEVIGRNCRFLQGPDTDQEAIDQLRQAIHTEKECHVVLKNYRKDGAAFWNDLTISPVRDESGILTHFIGIQTDITQRKIAEKELERSNTLLKAQQEAALDGILVIDEKRVITSYNQRFCEMWKIPKNVRHTGDKNLILNSILPLLAESLKFVSKIEFLEGNHTLVSRDEIQLNDGRFFDTYSAPAVSPDGECYGRVWSFRDITQQKQSEAKLKQQAEREQLLGGMNQRIRQSLKLNEVLNTAVSEVRHFLKCDRVIIFRFQPDWKGDIVVESVGEQWMSVMDKNIEDNCFQETKAPLYQQGRIKAVEDIYNADLTPCHIQLLESCQVRANLVVPILQEDNLWGLLVAHQCSGTRKWQEEDVELLKQLSVQLSVAIQQAALFQQLADELTERKAAEAALRKSEADLKKQTIKLEKTLKELKQAQLQLIQTEKMSSLGQLVAGVAHEINNPVTFIYGNLSHADTYAKDLLKLVELYGKSYQEPLTAIEELQEEIDLEFLVEDFPKLLHSMEMGVNRIRQIVQSLRNFSRLDEADRKLADIHEGIENTLLILQHRLKPEAANIQLIKEYGDLPLVECYPGQLNQVFMNILNNAIDALDKSDLQPSSKIGAKFVSGRNSAKSRIIKISTEVRDYSQSEELAVEKRDFPYQQSVVIKISDNGPGIYKKNQKRIFDPFFTTKPVGEGTGLGLSISYQIVVEKHGGRLECVSQLGEGTEFIVEIPLTPPDDKFEESSLAVV